ncbi:MAG: hypothetical protein Q7K34_01655 [archaeon]|nr:hypothetical protein [archaeon]
MIFLLGLALNVFAGPLGQVDIRVETFKQYPGEESSVFYQDNEIFTEITVINNSSTSLELEVNYELDSAEGEFGAIQRSKQLSVPAKESRSFSDLFQVPMGEGIASGTFIVKASAKEENQNLGQGGSVTGDAFITIFSGNGNGEALNVDETGFFLLPIIGFMALFLLKKKDSF